MPPFDKLTKLSGDVPTKLFPLKELIAVANAAERLSNCICEFGPEIKDYAAACGEYFEVLDNALANLKMAQAALP